MHRCRVCHRVLTDQASIDKGIGPLCEAHDYDRNEFQRDIFMSEDDSERLTHLKEQRSKLTQEIYDIETDEEIKKNQEFVGKYFKYRNSYSCPRSPEDYWWMYARVDRLNKSGIPVGVTFQTDSDGKIEIETSNLRVDMYWTKITSTEFAEAWIDAMDLLRITFKVNGMVSRS